MTDDRTGQMQTPLALLWAHALGVKKIAPHDNFFALGGHSLLGVKLIAAVREKFGLGEELQVTDLAEFPTLQAFGDHLAQLMAPGREQGEI